MKAGPVFLAVAAALLAGAAWLAWSQTDQGAVGVRGDDAPGEAPEAPLDVPEARPRFGTQAPADALPSWTQLNEQGIAALEEGRLEEAISAFEDCLEANPDEDVYARNLAEALARAAVRLHEAGTAEERLAAIQLLERATGLDPSREKLRELLGRWKRSAAAEEDFFVHPTTHFDLAYDLDRDEVRGEIDQVARLLESAYLSYSEALDIRPAEAGRPKIRVVLYTREGFDRVTGIGPWAGGVYDGTIRVPVGDLRRELARVRVVLRHELLHAFVQEKGGPRVPAWLNEGLAQWLELESPVARDGDVGRARAKLSGQVTFPLAKLAGSLASWEDETQIELAYAQALALVGWIAREYQSNSVQSVGVLFEMVAGCAEGVPVEETFQRRIGLSLDTVMADMLRD